MTRPNFRCGVTYDFRNPPGSGLSDTAVYSGILEQPVLVDLHLALGKDPPEPRPVQAADAGAIVAAPEVGGLHHRYERRLAAQNPPDGIFGRDSSRRSLWPHTAFVV